MALTEFQVELCRVISEARRQGRESYVAGGSALNNLLKAPRRSRDIDLFHDTDEALRRSWATERTLLESRGYRLEVLREAPSFVEALVSKNGEERTIVQWVRDSAFRFFPLLEDATFGLVLHPFDLATNKVLAMAGRLEPRDWIDLIESQDRLQPLGYLVWAACGKDPGFGPPSLLAELHRTGRYTQAELNELDFEGERPAAAALGQRWRRMLVEAEQVIEALPAEEVGKAVIHPDGELYRGDPATLSVALQAGDLRFHEGKIGGVWPEFKQGR